jgi:hypothetical protein
MIAMEPKSLDSFCRVLGNVSEWEIVIHVWNILVSTDCVNTIAAT